MKALVRNDGARARRAAVELGPFGIRVNTINASITPSFAVPAAAPEGGLVLVRLLHQRQEDTASIKLFLGDRLSAHCVQRISTIPTQSLTPAHSPS